MTVTYIRHDRYPGRRSRLDLLTQGPQRRIYRWEFPAFFTAQGRAHEPGWVKPLTVQVRLNRVIESRMDEHPLSSSPVEPAAALSADALRELQQRAQAALAASREQTARLEADITRQLDEIAATLREQASLEANVAAGAEHSQVELVQLREEYASAKVSWQEDRQSLVAERDELVRQVNDLKAQQHTLEEEWRGQLLDFESRLREQHSSWDEQRTDWTATRADLERERDELQQKFELALADVQRLRERATELESDLSCRPVAGQVASAELVALRVERDALSQRVGELERQPAAPVDADTVQQMADLQRRFELAVEDVRELKTKNAKLESQLAAAKSSSSAVAKQDSGGMDWESQKRRLLASLEDNSEDDQDPVLRKERTTIKNTIEITDAVIAEKDREIAELEVRLDRLRNDPSITDEARNRQIMHLVDADEVITDHRRRAQEHERALEEKLREAELELSVERAKLARQKAELEDLRATLDSQRLQNEAASGTVAAPGTPRRRWLSKLGIDGKE